MRPFRRRRRRIRLQTCAFASKVADPGLGLLPAEQIQRGRRGHRYVDVFRPLRLYKIKIHDGYITFSRDLPAPRDLAQGGARPVRLQLPVLVPARQVLPAGSAGPGPAPGPRRGLRARRQGPRIPSVPALARSSAHRRLEEPRRVRDRPALERQRRQGQDLLQARQVQQVDGDRHQDVCESNRPNFLVILPYVFVRLYRHFPELNKTFPSMPCWVEVKYLDNGLMRYEMKV